MYKACWRAPGSDPVLLLSSLKITYVHKVLSIVLSSWGELSKSSLLLFLLVLCFSTDAFRVPLKYFSLCFIIYLVMSVSLTRLCTSPTQSTDHVWVTAVCVAFSTGPHTKQEPKYIINWVSRKDNKWFASLPVVYKLLAVWEFLIKHRLLWSHSVSDSPHPAELGAPHLCFHSTLCLTSYCKNYCTLRWLSVSLLPPLIDS